MTNAGNPFPEELQGPLKQVNRWITAKESIAMHENLCDESAIPICNQPLDADFSMQFQLLLRREFATARRLLHAAFWLLPEVAKQEVKCSSKTGEWLDFDLGGSCVSDILAKYKDMASSTDWKDKLVSMFLGDRTVEDAVQGLLWLFRRVMFAK